MKQFIQDITGAWLSSTPTNKIILSEEIVALSGSQYQLLQTKERGWTQLDQAGGTTLTVKSRTEGQVSDRWLQTGLQSVINFLYYTLDRAR